MLIFTLGVSNTFAADYFTTQTPDRTTPLVVIDAQGNTDLMPQQFRTNQASYKPHLLRQIVYGNQAPPSREGLDTLSFSASGQFSKTSLQNMIKLLGGGFWIVDLRQESHGFAGDHAVSVYAPQNAINRGYTFAQRNEREFAFLDSLRAENPPFLRLIMDKDSGEICAGAPVRDFYSPVTSEEELAHDLGLQYARFPTLDHARPDDAVVDAFVTFVRTLPPGSHLHFHCRAGKGRTTQFLSMYDMMHNLHTHSLSFDDIVTRQYLIGGSALTDISSNPEAAWKKHLSKERLAFLKQFYAYIKNTKGKDLSWSEWRQQQKNM